MTSHDLLSVQPDILQYQEIWNPANRTAHLGFSVIVSDSVAPKIRLISVMAEVELRAPLGAAHSAAQQFPPGPFQKCKNLSDFRVSEVFFM
jgi:hypothetical protein